MHRFARRSTIKYLGFLSISLAACGDDDKKPISDPTDTTQPADTSAPEDTTSPSDVTDATGQPDTTGGTGVNTDPAAVATSDVAGHKRTVVNASGAAHWTYLSLTTGALVLPAPAGDDAFHLGFQRYLVKLGDGVRALTLDDVAFGDLDTAPASGEWKVDGEEAAISDWWDYDGATHVLTAKANRVYVVDVAGTYYKLRFRDYYDAGGSPGHVTFDWAEIAAPAVVAETHSLELALSSDYAYANLRTHTALDAAPEADALSWDIAVKRVSVVTNGGTSGAGQAGVIELGEGELADFDVLPAGATFTADSQFPVAGPPGSGDESRNGVFDSFYSYDMQTHAVTVNPKVYAVRLADGSVIKLRFTAWSSAAIAFEYAPLEVGND